MRRHLHLTLALALTAAAAGCGSDPAPSNAPPPATPAAPTAAADPYAAYLKIAPKDAPKLSREDAQTRALLGCDQKWAPGTVDAALAEAYAELCKKIG